MKHLRLFSVSVILLALTSCELFIDYSGTYAGSVDVSLTIDGTTTTTQSALSQIVTLDGGTYYLDGVPLEGTGSSYSYTVSDSGVDYVVNIEFTSTTLELDYSYIIDLGAGILYEYDISGVLEKQ